jgi:DNA-binding transcriptional LysR family regulator
MDRLKEMVRFVAVAMRGSLSAAAQLQGVAPAMVSRRLDALESRLGVKLLTRTTRRISLTFEGSAFLEDCQRILHQMRDAEASVSAGGIKASGHLRMTAPSGFGKRHVAPLIPGFLSEHRELSMSLELSDRLADMVNEGFDLAVRIGTLNDSTLIAVKLADMQRVAVASPDYLRRRGSPAHPRDLLRHDCLTFGNSGNQARGWAFLIDHKLETVRVQGPLECNDGAVLLDWALAGRGIAWRSMWEVGDALAKGELISILDGFRAPEHGIYAVVTQIRHMPLRTRLLIDYLKRCYASPAYWVAAKPVDTSSNAT